MINSNAVNFVLLKYLKLSLTFKYTENKKKTLKMRTVRHFASAQYCTLLTVGVSWRPFSSHTPMFAANLTLLPPVSVGEISVSVGEEFLSAPPYKFVNVRL